MRRTLRFLQGGECQYVRMRSHNGFVLFQNNADYAQFMKVLKKFKEMFDAHLYSFCLLPRSVHLIVHHTHNSHLTALLQEIQQAYAFYYRERYSHEGLVWTIRRQHTVLPDDRDLIDCIKAIEFLPIEEHLADSPIQYPWSSCSFRILGSKSVIDFQPIKRAMSLSSA